MKELNEISWDVTEEEYRKNPALSYSTLAKYEREGFNGLDKLHDSIETPSLTFGSAVDSIITGGKEEFDRRFMVADFPPVPDSVIRIVKKLFNSCKDKYRSLYDIPDDDIIYITQEESYQLNWKPETRAKVIKEKGGEYYSLLYLADNKVILDTYTYQSVYNAVQALKESESTRWYFADDNPFENVKRYYQLKFKTVLNGIEFRCMSDLLVVDYDNKTIIPVDLKTSSKPEWDFYKSFVEWNYQIQARLYWSIIRNILDKDEYFKNFELKDYLFIVVNRYSLTPLVWECPFTRCIGTLTAGDNKSIEMRDPIDIGAELDYYLKESPKVPKDINLTGTNDLGTWLNLKLD